MVIQTKFFMICCQGVEWCRFKFGALLMEGPTVGTGYVGGFFLVPVPPGGNITIWFGSWLDPVVGNNRIWHRWTRQHVTFGIIKNIHQHHTRPGLGYFKWSSLGDAEKWFTQQKDWAYQRSSGPEKGLQRIDPESTIERGRGPIGEQV